MILEDLATESPWIFQDKAILGIGIVGVLVLLILKVVKEMIQKEDGSSKSNGNSGAHKTQENYLKDIDDRVEKIQYQVAAIHKMADRSNEDGVPVWYVPASLKSNTEKLVLLTEAVKKELSEQKGAVELHQKAIIDLSQNLADMSIALRDMLNTLESIRSNVEDKSCPLKDSLKNLKNEDSSSQNPSRSSPLEK